MVLPATMHHREAPEISSTGAAAQQGRPRSTPARPPTRPPACPRAPALASSVAPKPLLLPRGWFCKSLLSFVSMKQLIWLNLLCRAAPPFFYKVAHPAPEELCTMGRPPAESPKVTPHEPRSHLQPHCRLRFSPPPAPKLLPLPGWVAAWLVLVLNTLLTTLVLIKNTAGKSYQRNSIPRGSPGPPPPAWCVASGLPPQRLHATAPLIRCRRSLFALLQLLHLFMKATPF